MLIKLGLLALGIALIGFVVANTKLLISKTDSLPYRVFLLRYNSKFDKGNYIGIIGHKIKYYNNLPLVKQIIGMPGDKVSVVDGWFYINDTKYGKLNKVTKFEEVLIPIKPQIIPEGMVFAYAPHARSFDSRYQDFGLVPLSTIKGRAYALF